MRKIFSLGEKRERDTQRGRKLEPNGFSLSLPKSRGVMPDARALDNTNASSLARRYKTNARTVESPKLWPSLRRALCEIEQKERGKKNTSEFLNASSEEKRELSIKRRRENNFGKLCDFARKVSSFKHRALRFFVRERKRERERERERDVPFVPRSRAEP